jgi:hypothetical protein
MTPVACREGRGRGQGPGQGGGGCSHRLSTICSYGSCYTVYIPCRIYTYMYHANIQISYCRFLGIHPLFQQPTQHRRPFLKGKRQTATSDTPRLLLARGECVSMCCMHVCSTLSLSLSSFAWRTSIWIWVHTGRGGIVTCMYMDMVV